MLTRIRFLTPQRTIQHTLTIQRAMSTTPASNPSTSTSQTPLEDSIRTKLTTSLSPTTLSIANDSAAHAHHKAMANQPSRGQTVRETHFRLVVVSEAFQAKPQPARHRMVYKILGEELAMEGGVHALQLVTRTPLEQERVEGTKRDGA